MKKNNLSHNLLLKSFIKPIVKWHKKGPILSRNNKLFSYDINQLLCDGYKNDLIELINDYLDNDICKYHQYQLKELLQYIIEWEQPEWEPEEFDNNKKNYLLRKLLNSDYKVY